MSRCDTIIYMWKRDLGGKKLLGWFVGSVDAREDPKKVWLLYSVAVDTVV